MSEAAAAIIDEDEAVISNPASLQALMRKFKTEESVAAPKKAARKAREKKVRSIADGRSLKAKGRTEQFNVMIKPEIKQVILARAKEEGISMADLLERALLKEFGMWSN
jgi:predicted HicB family RNase H-like nuclease